MERSAEFRKEYAGVFEPALMTELESKSILMNVSAGEIMLRIGKPVTGVPLLLSGTFKVSRVTDDGQELLLYYVRTGETCPMALTCFMTSQLSSINGSAEEDSSLLVVPGPVVDELFQKYPSWKKFVMTTILDGLTGVIKCIDDVVFKKTDDRSSEEHT